MPKYRAQHGIVKELTIRHVLFREDQYLATIEYLDPMKPCNRRYAQYIVPRESYTSLSPGVAVGIPVHWRFEKDVTFEWRLNEWGRDHIVGITAIGLGMFAIAFGVLTLYSYSVWR